MFRSNSPQTSKIKEFTKLRQQNSNTNLALTRNKNTYLLGDGVRTYNTIVTHVPVRPLKAKYDHHKTYREVGEIAVIIFNRCQMSMIIHKLKIMLQQAMNVGKC